MKLISHRRNTIAQLRETPRHLGVEVDIRSIGSRLVIHHDAFVDGESFDDWLAHYEQFWSSSLDRLTSYAEGRMAGSKARRK